MLDVHSVAAEVPFANAVVSQAAEKVVRVPPNAALSLHGKTPASCSGFKTYKRPAAFTRAECDELVGRVSDFCKAKVQGVLDGRNEPTGGFTSDEFIEINAALKDLQIDGMGIRFAGWPGGLAQFWLAEK
jgi:hypothetical protein